MMIRPFFTALEAEAGGRLGPLESVVRDVTRMYQCHSGTDPRTPAIHLSTTGDVATVVLELPGVEASTLDLEVSENVLAVSGSRPAVQDEVNYLRRERPLGPFRRTIRLPFDVELDAVRAVNRDGMLTVTLPRAEASKPRKITVESYIRGASRS